MASQTLLTYGAKLSLVEQTYYSPVSLISGSSLTSMYVFLAQVTPWADVNNPPVPTQDQKSIKKIMKNIFVAKLIRANDISPVIRRINWETGTTYNYYQDNIDMFQLDINDYPIQKFYVKNRYDQVFKCLSNNYINAINTSSTYEPYFEPGSYNTNKIYQGADGYKWKYIYTVDIAAKIKFMDSTWLPIPVDGSPNPFAYPAGFGDIDVINVLNGGSGYNTSNAIVSVAITGDGLGCTATANVKNGSIDFISVISTGTNYTVSNVAITSTQGSGAIAIAPVSPIGGHGSNPISELGCSHIMVTSTFTGSETDPSGNDLIPIDINYYQLGVLINPTSMSTTPNKANGSIYKTSTDLVVASGFGSYISNEIIYQGTSLATSTFSGTVLSFDSAKNIIKVINTTGSLTTNAPVFGNISSSARTLLSYNIPDFMTISGVILYIENRTGITRSGDGIEQFKIVLSF